MKNSLAKNTVYKTILNICNIIIPIIVGPYVLRVLDRSYYDLFNSLNADFAILLVVGGFGIYTYGVREISRVREDKAKVSKLFSELFFIGVVTNLLVMAGYITYAFLSSGGDNLKKYLCLILAIQFLGNIFNEEWINEANENYRFIAIKSILIRILYLVSIFVLVRKANDILAYVGLLTGSTVLNMFVSFLYISRKNKITVKGLQFKKHLLPLLIIFIISNVAILYAQSDKIMLKYFVHDAGASVTSYQISQYISSLIYNLLIPIVIVSLPRLANLFVKDKDQCYETHSRVYNTYLVLAIPSLVGAALLSTEIIMLYGGDKYMDCVTPLAIYTIAQLMSSGCYIFGDAFMYITGHEKNLLINNLIGGIVNISMNFIFIACGIFNTSLAVLSIAVAYFVAALLDYIYIRWKIKYKLRVLNKHSLLYVVASLSFIPIVLGVKNFHLNIFVTIAVDIIACAGLYFLALMVFDDQIFKGLFDRFIGRFFKRRRKVENKEWKTSCSLS